MFSVTHRNITQVGYKKQTGTVTLSRRQQRGLRDILIAIKNHQSSENGYLPLQVSLECHIGLSSSSNKGLLQGAYRIYQNKTLVLSLIKRHP